MFIDTDESKVTFDFSCDAYTENVKARITTQEVAELLGIDLTTLRRQLARAQKMMGDEAAARKSYGTFLDLWKNADPDIPILKEAKAEYAKLQ